MCDFSMILLFNLLPENRAMNALLLSKKVNENSGETCMQLSTFSWL